MEALMKLVLALFLIAPSAFANKTVIDFNQVLNEEIESDIKADEDKFKTRPADRRPASVEPEGIIIEQDRKIDKNVRQIGPKYW